MPRYRFYVLDDDDHIVSRHEIQYLDDDLAVLGAAEEFPGTTVEIWDGARCVLTNAHDEFRYAETAPHQPAGMMF